MVSPSYWEWGGAGGVGGDVPITVSSETDPTAESIDVEVEQGYYNVNLAVGWSMERVENGVATPVEAQLLSGDPQLNIDMTVYENPDQYYGGGVAGAPGNPGPTGVAGAVNW